MVASSNSGNHLPGRLDERHNLSASPSFALNLGQSRHIQVWPRYMNCVSSYTFALSCSLFLAFPSRLLLRTLDQNPLTVGICTWQSLYLRMYTWILSTSSHSFDVSSHTLRFDDTVVYKSLLTQTRLWLLLLVCWQLLKDWPVGDTWEETPRCWCEYVARNSGKWINGFKSTHIICSIFWKQTNPRQIHAANAYLFCSSAALHSARMVQAQKWSQFVAVDILNGISCTCTLWIDILVAHIWNTIQVHHRIAHSIL